MFQQFKLKRKKKKLWTFDYMGKNAEWSQSENEKSWFPGVDILIFNFGFLMALFDTLFF